MTTYRLLPPEGTCTFRKIMHGRKWVGRVYQNEDGTWRGVINRQERGQGSTPKAAFADAVSKHLGYADVAALDALNSIVRRQNRARKQHARHVLNQIINGNFKPLDELLRR